MSVRTFEETLDPNIFYPFILLIFLNILMKKGFFRYFIHSYVEFSINFFFLRPTMSMNLNNFAILILRK